MASIKSVLAVVAASAIGVLMTACGGSSGTGTTKTTNPVTPTVTVTTSTSTLTNGQAFSITIAVAGPSGDATPTGSIALSLGSNSLPAGTLAGGSLTVNLPSGSWSAPAGNYQLTASYTPDSGSSSTYTSASGKSGTLTVAAPPTTYQLSVTASQTGIPVTATTDVNGFSTEQTPFEFTYDAGTTVTVTAPATSGSYTFSSWTGCTSTSGNTCNVTMTADTTVTANYTTTAPTTYSLTLASTNPASGARITASVADNSGNSSGQTPFTFTYNAGTQVTLTAVATVGANAFGSWTGCTPTTGTSCTVTVNANTTATANYTTPAATVTVDQSSNLATATDQILGVNLEAWYDVVANASTVVGPMQNAGMQALRWPGGSWSDAYHWNSGGTPYMCTCSSATSCTANSTGWAGNADEDFSDFETSIAKAGTAGFDLALTANYGTNEACNGGGDPAEAASWAAAAVTDGHPASHITIGNEEYGSWETDLHATAHDPTTYADAVIGPSGYYDLIKAQSPTTLVGVVVDADCTSSSGCTDNWDTTMLPLAAGSYDFVEYHYYPEYQSAYDSNLIGVASPSYVANFTANINTIQSELTTAGEVPCTSATQSSCIPIYVGEISSNSANGGTQNWSITQALYAGQILGEAMNDGVSRLTWWDGFGNCMGSSDPSNPLPPNNSTLYGWQDWGAQDIFSAGASTDANCPNDGAAGTLSPTALAFQLFSNVAVDGATVLKASVTGDTTDVHAYAATHNGGTALVLFNLNKTTARAVEITLSSSTSTTDLQVLTYDKEMYDYTNVNCQSEQTGQANGNNCTYDKTHNYSTVDWVQQPTTTDLGAQTLPYTLTLQPWSMNVVIIK